MIPADNARKKKPYVAGDEDARVTRVFEAMLECIEQGTWPPGSRVPSVPALAREYKVSQSTAGRAAERLRLLEFLTGPQGGQTRVASAEALNFARAAWASVKQARAINRQT